MHAVLAAASANGGPEWDILALEPYSEVGGFEDSLRLLARVRIPGSEARGRIGGNVEGGSEGGTAADQSRLRSASAP